ncbi:MAG TPA: hypothetical protein VF838_15325 [Trebonia sp.]
MSWETGSDRIRELLSAGELGQVPPDTGPARRMLADATRHLATAAAAESAGDLPGASRIRRARNSFEYPSTETPGPSGDDVNDAIRVAREVNDAAGKILESQILYPW